MRNSPIPVLFIQNLGGWDGKAIETVTLKDAGRTKGNFVEYAIGSLVNGGLKGCGAIRDLFKYSYWQSHANGNSPAKGIQQISGVRSELL